MLSRWRNQKKIKLVFTLQFQVTQVPQSSGKTTLVLSLVPEDAGKRTVKLKKAAVQNGTCSWESPVSESMTFIKHLKTGQMSEKIYFFLVSTGSRKKDFLGEVWVNFADYVGATKPFTVSLPLDDSIYGPILHVTIQSIQGALDDRMVEDDGTATLDSRDTTSQQNTDPATVLSPLTQNFIHQEGTVNAMTLGDHAQQQSSTECSVQSDEDASLSDTILCPDYSRKELQETSDSIMEQLKSENAQLSRQADVTEIEVRSLRKQVVNESRRAEDLSRKISILKQERDVLKTECKRLQSQQKCIDDDKSDLYKQKFTELNSGIDVYRRDKEELQMQVQQLVSVNRMLEEENHRLCSKLEQKEIDHEKTQNAFSSSITDIEELQQQVEFLEQEQAKKDRKLLESMCKIDELGTQVRTLVEELTSHVEELAELQAWIHTKLDLGGMHAKESLRETRLKNTETAEILKQGLNKISKKLKSKFNENNGPGLKGTSSVLPLQIKDLKEVLEDVNKELKLTKFGVNIKDISQYINEKGEQLELMSLELHKLCAQLECAKLNEEEKNKAFSAEIKTLAAEIDKLRQENHDISKETEQKEKLQQEIEQMKISMGETEKVKHRWNEERAQLEIKYASLKKEAENSQEELITLKCLTEEKETMIGNLLSELRHLQGQCNELKHKISKEELKKETLRKDENHLEGEVKEVEEENNCIDSKLESISRRLATDMPMTSRNDPLMLPDSKQDFSLVGNLTLLEEGPKAAYIPENMYIADSSEHLQRTTKIGNREMSLRRNEETCSAGGANDFSFQTSDQCSTKLLAEVAALKEKNKTMEDELKEMQVRYSDISLKFAEVEGERQKLVMIVRNLNNAKRN